MSERTTKDSNRSTNGKAKARVTTARRQSEPRLGEIEFSEWYETAVFEPSSEERMETIATGGRAPSRLVARVVLAAGARRERRRAERQHRETGPEENVQPAPESSAPAVSEAAPEQAPAVHTSPAPEPAAAVHTSPAPEPAPAVHTSPAPEPVAVAAVSLVDPIAPASLEVPAEPTLEPTPEAPPVLTVDDDLELVEPKPAEPAIAATPAEPTGPEPVLIPELVDRPGWRQKASDLLDRWAEKEVAVATKLDEALAPAIPWGGHKKPAHSRRHRGS